MIKASIILTKAGRSPTFWTRRLALLGPADTRGRASPIEELLSFKMDSALASLMSPLKWTRTRDSSLDSQVQVYSSNYYTLLFHYFLTGPLVDPWGYVAESPKKTFLRNGKKHRMYNRNLLPCGNHPSVKEVSRLQISTWPGYPRRTYTLTSLCCQ